MCFVLALWSLGWAFLWYWAPNVQPVEDKQRMLSIPPAWLLQLKYISVAGECYNYCGFSFFPALPWKAMEVPPSIPHPQRIMLAGFPSIVAADVICLPFAAFTGRHIMIWHAEQTQRFSRPIDQSVVNFLGGEVTGASPIY